MDMLRERGYDIRAFNASERSALLDRSGELGLLNRRSAAWWTLRELLDPVTETELAIPPDELLAGDLVSPTWRTTSAGRIQVEGKDGIRKRLGRSTDHGDAVVQAFAPEEPVEQEYVLTYDDPAEISPY